MTLDPDGVALLCRPRCPGRAPQNARGGVATTSPRWRRTVTNGLGQTLRQESPGPNGQLLVVEHSYNNKGQRTATSRTGMADILYVYDDLGRMIRPRPPIRLCLRGVRKE